MDRENSWGGCDVCGKPTNARLAGFDFLCIECTVFLCGEEEQIAPPAEYECAICFSTVNTSEGHARPTPCNCDVCSECFTNWCLAKIDEACTVIRCPLNSRATSRYACTQAIEQNVVEGALMGHPEKLRKYTMLKADLRSDPHVKTCPGCGYVTAHQDEGLTVTCTECAMQWCFPCHAPSHLALTCAEYIKSQEKHELKSQRWSRRHTKACPSCCTRIQRGEGCRHMLCSLCETHFCYGCGAKLFDGDTAPYYHRKVCTARNRYRGVKTALIIITLPITLPTAAFLMASVGLYEGSRIAIRAAKDLVVGKHHVDAEEQEVNSVL